MTNNAAHKLHVLFVLRSYWWLGSLRTFLRELIGRGYRVTVLFDLSASEKQSLEEVAALEGSLTGIQYGWARRPEKRNRILFHIRELLSYRRYLIFKEQDKFYRERWHRYLHQWLQKILRFPLVERVLALRVVGALLRLAERVIPPYQIVIDHLKGLKPDAVVVSPVNMRYSTSDLEYLKAALRLCIPTILPVASWDNLTNKGVIHIIPDRVLVWNETQGDEARKHHGIPEDRMRVVGSIYFDEWFSFIGKPVPREMFCKSHGLDPRPRIVLYLGSSSAAADDESWLVEEIRQALDASSDERLRTAQLVIRAHPSHHKIYERLRGYQGISFVPHLAALPLAADDKALYYQSAYHACAVIEGANTSAVMPVFIFDKPVIAVLSKKHRQENVFHFQQLRQENVMHFTYSAKEAISKVAEILGGADPHAGRRQDYVRRYLRPRGLDISAASYGVDELEALVREKSSEVPPRQFVAKR